LQEKLWGSYKDLTPREKIRFKYVAMSCCVVWYIIPDSLNILLRLLDPEDESKMITENDREPFSH
jgi:hypothetical protein